MEGTGQFDVARAKSTGTRDLRAWHIYLILLGWTLFSVFIYSHYSQLGDSQAYLTGSYDEESQARTFVISWISSAVLALVRSEFLTHVVFSLFAASGVAYLAKQAGVQGRYRWPLLAILLNPNFGVWASVTGREPIFVCLLAFFMGAVLAYYRKPGFLHAIVALVTVFGMTFIRLPYGLGLSLFLLMFLAYRSGPRIRLSLGVQAFLIIAVIIGVLAIVWPYIDRYISEEVLPKAKSYFTVYSATTRTWVNLQTTGDLFGSLWWSLPLALVGPTPREVWHRPEMLPFLISGLVVLAALMHSIWVSFAAPAGQLRKILVLGWLPAMTVILITYIPFGVYNPGSAIRYASSFLLFVIFPSMLLSTVAAQYAPVVIRERHVPRVRWRRA
jgi:hypothetical protein